MHWELTAVKFKGQSLGVSQSNPWDEGQLSSMVSSDDVHLKTLI